MSTSPVGFDPSRRPRVPGGLENSLRERENYFDPKIGEDEDGFTLRDAESLGWNVDLFHASKPFPGRGLIEVRAGSDVLDSNEGRYGVLLAIYEYELGEHRRRHARAREAYLRLVREERLQLRALNSAKAAREEAPAVEPESSEEDRVVINVAHRAEQEARREALGHARQALTLSKELDAYGLLELPQEYLDELTESKPPKRKETDETMTRYLIPPNVL